MNNLLFLGITFAIFWGTIYPLVAEALADQKVSVGPPFFKQVVGPLLGALLLLMGIGPLMPWRRASRDHLRQNFLIPVSGTVIGLAVLFVLGMRDRFALLGFGLCLFVLGTIVQEFVRGTLARHSATGENFVAALGNLVRRNNRRYGGYVVHLGILLIGAGVVASQVYQQEAQANLAPGESMQLGGYTIVAHGIQTDHAAGRARRRRRADGQRRGAARREAILRQLPESAEHQGRLALDAGRRPVRGAGGLGWRRGQRPS